MTKAVLTTEPLIKIHSAIADCGNWPEKNHKGQVKYWDAVKLWYYLRSLDVSGAGWAEIGLVDTAKFFDRSIYTVRRWLKQGVEIKAFRAIAKLGNKYRVYYSSLANFAIAVGLTNLGAIAYVKPEDLKNLKFAATEAEAMRLQQQTHFNESRKHSNGTQNKEILTPEQLVSCELGTRAILFRSGRFTFLALNAAYYGTTQKRIAWQLNRHESTVQRRLSTKYRQKRNVASVPKTQLVTPPRTYSTGGDTADAPSKVKILPGQRIIRVSKGVFRLGANVYAAAVQTTVARAERWRLKRAIAKLEVTESWKLDPEYEALMSAWKSALNHKV